MSEPVWNAFLTERDKQVFAASGYGARGGFGKRPALLVIDVNYAFCGDKPEPILESIKRWRNSCGEDSWPAVAAIRSLCDKAHEKGIPVIYTTGVRREDNWDSGSWSWKNSRSTEKPTVPVSNIDGNQIVDEIAPASQDIVIDAYRRESLSENELGLGSALYVNGYRVGMLLASGGGLILADHTSFAFMYQVMAACMAINLCHELVEQENAPIQ